MPKDKHTTVRLSDVARERLDRLSPDYSSQTAAIEDALEVLENGKVAFGQQVRRAVADLIAATQARDEKRIGGAQMQLAELLHSMPAATGIAKAIWEARAWAEEEKNDA